MVSHRPLIAVGLIVVVLLGMTGPIAAHETRNVDGYNVTFGGADEPLITGERTWLELEIVDNETGEPAEGQADALQMYVETAGNDREEITLGEKHGEPGVYEAAVIFTEPGEYTIHVEGEIEGTGVHTHFEKEVTDHTDLEYPGAEANATGSDDTQTDNQADEAGVGSALTRGLGVIAVAGLCGVLLVRRHR